MEQTFDICKWPVTLTKDIIPWVGIVNGKIKIVEVLVKIAILGAGGVGGYFGGKLAHSGEDVTFIARGAHLDALRSKGLKVDSIRGDFFVQPVKATDNPAEAGPVEVVLVAVKAWQVNDAAVQMKPLVGPETFIVPLLNGVESPEQLAGVFGKERVLGGLCRISSFLEAPGHIRHVGIDPYVVFGELDGGSSPRAERLRQCFQRAGVGAEVAGDILASMWQKFTFIAPLSGVGAVTRSPVGAIRTVPGVRQMLVEAMQEVEAVARAHDIKLPEDIVEKTMAFVDNLPEHTTTSMQRDIQDGRASELEAQNGAVLRLGQEAGVPTPVNAFLYHSLLPSELQAREKK